MRLLELENLEKLSVISMLCCVSLTLTEVNKLISRKSGKNVQQVMYIAK